MTEKKTVEEKLGELARLAEDLGVECFEQSEDVARKLTKIGKYVRKLETCMRVYGQLPMEHPQSPIVKAARIADRLYRKLESS